jgi:hypothetical protein
VHINGTGFKNYGQKLWVYFDTTAVLATIVNDTALKVPFDLFVHSNSTRVE